jgi:hypothetical protein
VAANHDAWAVHEAAGCRDVGEGEALFHPAAAGLCPDYGACVRIREAVMAGSARVSKEGVDKKL